MIDALDIQVKGIVQGVGFRPFVYRLAKRYLINGWVKNASDGVHIHAEGESELIDQFVLEISENAPQAATVTEINIKEVPLEPFDTFEIRMSDDATVEETTQISPDLAMCADCERELFNKSDRRFHYPFINCTNCGPRFTIIDALPYDRANTSMRSFTMCNNCESEYNNPEDRRFHAQPDACFSCGPHIWLTSEETQVGESVSESDEIISNVADILLDGKVVAVKGLGGYHLAVDANNECAVKTLRERKHRDGKPFAVMMETLADVRRVCNVSDEEAAVLTGSVRPIVLLRKRYDMTRAKIDVGVADELDELGVMLPYTPLQRLLLHEFAEKWNSQGIHENKVPMLVMTSGNVHDEPIAIDDAEAKRRLENIADAFLGNDRQILTRFDDSIVRIIQAGSNGAAIQMVRRARGYAPQVINVKLTESPSNNDNAQSASQGGTSNQNTTIFAAGPEQKNTFTFLHGSEAYVSQHIGDMENADTFDAWLEAKVRFEGLFELKANQFSCDMHPEYITSKWARERTKTPVAEKGEDVVTSGCVLPKLTEVQHHHAHVVSVIAENSLEGPVLGVAFDGTGYGMDATIWGGEFLVANSADFERFANFAYVPMPGGASAIKKPLQMAYGALWAFDLLDHPASKTILSELGETQCQNLETMIDCGINTPQTSSVGRLFDAASALLGICTAPSYEGEGAILLEAELWKGVNEEATAANMEDGSVNAAGHTTSSMYGVSEAYPIDIVKNTATKNSTAHDTSVVLLDAAPTFKALLDDIENSTAKHIVSRRFHNAFVNAIVEVSQLAQALYGINTVTLSGGVFLNRYLMEGSISALEAAGFTVAINKELPPGDGSVSFGEAVVTYAKTIN